MKLALIITPIIVTIILIIGVILTISAANSTNENYSGQRSFSSLLWAYVLTIPFVIIVVIIAIMVFQFF